MGMEMILLLLSIISTILSLEAVESTESPRPHIIFIIADDLGWNDVGFHGSNQIPTPNIDALAYGGLILNRYYVNPICTPSRSALMTGKHPIHTGMQHTVLYGAEARGLPLTEKLLPQYLEELGYENHIVGKWHLGCYKKEYTPLYRGFKSHLGYWTGHQDYFDHSAVEAPGWGLDMRRGMEAAYDLHGRYSTDLFGEEAARIVRQHDPTRPLFLYLAHAAVHSANPYNPLPAPDESVEEFGYVEGYKRRRFAAMLSKLDHSVGELTKALQESQMLNNSIIVFTTDNGGPAAGFNLNAASNWPLRGVKNTLWEGGVRGAALVWSRLIEVPKRVAKQSMHIVDWLPTLVEAAGGDVSQLSGIDGISLWTALSKDEQSKRTEILHNIDDIYQNAAVTVGSWKLLKGTTYDGTWDGWYGPSGRGPPYAYNTSAVEDCPTGRALRAVGGAASATQMAALRREADVQCEPPTGDATAGNSSGACRPLEAPCLFNVEEDPCEKENLASKYPKILQKLTNILDRYNATAIPPGNLPLDPKGDPKNWNYVWTNFGDYTNETVI